MKNFSFKSKKKKGFNSKKGLTLIELIVAIMILMLVISASVSGLNLSYRSVLVGAQKDDSQSLAQRNCDILMSVISSYAETDDLDTIIVNTPGSSVAKFDDAHFTYILNDVDLMNCLSGAGGAGVGGYDTTQFAELKQCESEAEVKTQAANDFSTGDSTKKQYCVLSVNSRDLTETDGTTQTYDVYKIKVYVYYNAKGFITCEGEVNVKVT
ncbi:MAG: prepilin-type N-terminal cleavage/methylation domain-containing protein [Acutalibacteraceae bacterium]|nr:prepilin-type N-terminal cleavage/methylation domain-containing protein [Acutalibacteraceae bacterium]